VSFVKRSEAIGRKLLSGNDNGCTHHFINNNDNDYNNNYNSIDNSVDDNWFDDNSVYNNNNF
jgi:hypothetical protein